MAKVERLAPFNDLDLIDMYAHRYGKDPDLEVFPVVRFDTMISLAAMWKEKGEYGDRFSYFWKKMVNETDAEK